MYKTCVPCKIRREFLETTLDCPQCGQPLTDGPGATSITPAENERLAVLMEECAEVIQAAAKIQRFGYDGFYHDGMGNRDQLEREIGQVNNIIRMMIECGDIDSSRILKSHHEKAMTIGKYLVHRPWPGRDRAPHLSAPVSPSSTTGSTRSPSPVAQAGYFYCPATKGECAEPCIGSVCLKLAPPRPKICAVCRKHTAFIGAACAVADICSYCGRAEGWHMGFR